MGILNLTPDSFYDGGKYNSEQLILKHVENMLIEGATFVDIGAYSSRPKATHISEEEERARLLPVLERVMKQFPDILISIDTFRSNIAAESIAAGACMINDISAGQMDKNMFGTVARLQVPYLLMHMRGTPQTMQQQTDYNDLVKEIIIYFSEKIFELRKLGLNDIVLDPGFGFSKTLKQNYELLAKLDLLSCLELPILAGLSRKSMLYKFLGTNAEQALNATTVANTISLQKGASILRVHDVKEAIETIRIMEKIKDESPFL